MRDHKIWNSDLGKVFIERQDRIKSDIEKAFKLGRGGQAIDDMLKSPVNKAYNELVAPQDSRIKKDKASELADLKARLDESIRRINEKIKKPVYQDLDFKDQDAVRAEKEYFEKRK